VKAQIHCSVFVVPNATMANVSKQNQSFEQTLIIKQVMDTSLSTRPLKELMPFAMDSCKQAVSARFSDLV
jgi:hypothetical protein